MNKLEKLSNNETLADRLSSVVKNMRGYAERMDAVNSYPPRDADKSFTRTTMRESIEGNKDMEAIDRTQLSEEQNRILNQTIEIDPAKKVFDTDEVRDLANQLEATI
ncbi:MAG: hypothetical protein ABIA11_00555 [Patescibacteria group bacterium]